MVVAHIASYAFTVQTLTDKRSIDFEMTGSKGYKQYCLAEIWVKLGICDIGHCVRHIKEGQVKSTP